MADQKIGTPKRIMRVAIVTENFLPKIDGVTRTLARLLEHLQAEGHIALVLGPNSGMSSYAGHEVVGTKGLPLLGVYKGLKLNFIRPKFITRLLEFEPDVVHFVDPIWLCAQTIPAVQYYLPNTPLVTSYHTNLAMYATLFGFSWLTPVMWRLQRNLHGRCKYTFCPSPSTQAMLHSKGFQNVRLWPRGADLVLFTPEARDLDLRRSWGAEPPLDETSPRLKATEGRTNIDIATLDLDSSELPPYSFAPAHDHNARSKIVVLYVGRISWEKNLRLLVEAFRGLQEAGPSRPACQLVFVGDGPARPAIAALCKSYGIDAVFAGYRKGAELAAHYASADIFAFPSWSETFGQVVLEALSSGLPVAGLRAEGVCDLVQHERTGLLLDLNELIEPNAVSKGQLPTAHTSALPANPHALVSPDSATFPKAVAKYRSLIEDLATNHTKRKLMGACAREDARKRTWHEAMEMLVDGYREVAASDVKGPSSPRQPSEKMMLLHEEPVSAVAATRRRFGLTLRRGKRSATVRRSVSKWLQPKQAAVSLDEEPVMEQQYFIHWAYLLFVCCAVAYWVTPAILPTFNRTWNALAAQEVGKVA